jgi:hypothetical protein
MTVHRTPVQVVRRAQQLRSYHRYNRHMYMKSHEIVCRRRNALASAGKNAAEGEAQRGHWGGRSGTDAEPPPE